MRKAECCAKLFVQCCLNHIKLTKDVTILQLLTHLQQRFGKGLFFIEDYWDADLCAIGLTDASNNYTLYVSSYGKPNDTYYAELEGKTQSGNLNKTKKVYESLTKQELEEVISRHFLNQVQ